MWLTFIITGFLGLIIGSFINVIIIRMRTGRSFITGRSKCVTCNHTLAWHDLIPILSFCILKGHCKYCRAPLSFQYIIVEIITCVWFLAVFYIYGISIGGIITALVGIFAIIIAIYDLRHKIIPDTLSYILICLGIILAVVGVSVGWNIILPAYAFIGIHTIIDYLIACIAIPLPFFLLWKVSGGRWFGLGDVKYMIGIGLIFGFLSTLEIVMSSFWIALVIVIILALFEKVAKVFGFGRNRISEEGNILSFGREIPFGPFLSIALMLELLDIHIFQLLFF
ncbi:hypothetical protein A2997_02525 [Candidatus Nomurabacteria bacterium RIFCSPLOWO2_01_FULL_36_10b]|uniref:Peptidase A24A N-terminal domain-containing protein n=1 Tax=Candidatus Nomurabacteria bacterium RIFCSPLOWO2_01_FULL_36_10b TaxID=1801766 RepID=A0A1F6WN98_9BACT|nr:MAG: hypothetical protein A2997_02525 [Candidatus Nomurabacteria bacterium RIFCSPLOWO2_01_FULL_36_10b]